MAKGKGLFGRCFNNCAHTLCIFPENGNRYELHFFILKYLPNLSFCHYFDQGRRSCPGASCICILALADEMVLRYVNGFMTGKE